METTCLPERTTHQAFAGSLVVGKIDRRTLDRAKAALEALAQETSDPNMARTWRIYARRNAIVHGHDYWKDQWTRGLLK